VRTLTLIGCLSLFLVVPASAGEVFAARNLTLREVAPLVGKATGKSVILGIDGSSPAHKIRATLVMPVEEENDLLNAVSAAYGLRWVTAPKDGSVTLVSKKTYRSSSAGLRQGLADAILEPQRVVLVGDRRGRLRTAESHLKLSPVLLMDLEVRTTGGHIVINELPKYLREPALNYLDTMAAWKLGAVCDQYYLKLKQNPLATIWYGKNDYGSRQFLFQTDRGGIAVSPE
jgi:hypothetical protein